MAANGLTFEEVFVNPQEVLRQLGKGKPGKPALPAPPTPTDNFSTRTWPGFSSGGGLPTIPAPG